MTIPGYHWMLLHWGEKGVTAFCFAFIISFIISLLIYILINVKKWNAVDKAERHRKGYNFAAGLILQGKSENFIEDQIPNNNHRADEFDKGIFEAIKRGRELKILNEED